MSNDKKGWIRAACEDICAHKVTAIVYFVLRLSVVITMIVQFMDKNYNGVFMCVLTLLLFMIPTFVDRRLHIDLPNTLEIIILAFIYSAQILGEIREYYLIYEEWDTILHTINGFLAAAVGFAMIDILNQTERFHFKMSPGFVAVVSFCFSMTIGVLWEFFEFFMDQFAGTDMQKDTFIDSITTVALNPDGRNIPITIEVEEILVNGVHWPGYLDIGLYDTMMDLLVNFVGAVIFSVFGYFYIKNRGRNDFILRFIPRRRAPEDRITKRSLFRKK